MAYRRAAFPEPIVSDPRFPVDALSLRGPLFRELLQCGPKARGLSVRVPARLSILTSSATPGLCRPSDDNRSARAVPYDRAKAVHQRRERDRKGVSGA